MGWTFTHRDPGRPVAEFLREEFGHDNDRYAGRVLDCAVVDLSEAYLALEHVDKTLGTREVAGVVCLIRFVRAAEYNFGYKEMSETEGPGASRCPKRILDLLTPTDNASALQWRGRCRDRIRRAEERPRIRKGDVIVFPREVLFDNGARRRSLIAAEPARLRYTDEDGRTYRLRRDTIREDRYEIHRGGVVIHAPKPAEAPERP